MKLNKNPEFDTEVKMMCNAIVKIENPYLQAWADAGAIVMCSAGYWIMTKFGQLWFKIGEESMHLECISTYVDQRKHL